MNAMKVQSKYALFILIILGWQLLCCSNSISDYEEYMRYVSDEDNGLVKHKAIAGIQMSVKYLPVDYSVYRELKELDEKPNEKQKKKLRDSYKNSALFMLTLGPDTNETFDITKVGVSNYGEFAERMEIMNFNMASFIQLEVNKKIYTPQLAQMENTYGLEKKRNILVVFSTPENTENQFMTKQDVKFIFNDGLFNTGVNKFLFQHQDFENLPKFVF